MKSENIPTFSVFICFSCIIVMIIQKVFLSLHQYIILSDATVQNIYLN